MLSQNTPNFIVLITWPLNSNLLLPTAAGTFGEKHKTKATQRASGQCTIVRPHYTSAHVVAGGIIFYP